ncbi:hypothetical protein OSB04_019153 [Centaurea solstitialis]|uniref:Uncharacterized protein n=1 Tax=Centaurea solstitialis TaxID=347529 RepID=A0AA38T203_9ASTR|nr:hypothetical protein OSB04_019153 [Centaurea solstitialis]
MGTKTKDVLMVKNGEVKKKRGHGNTSKGKDQVLATLSAPSVYHIGKGKGKLGVIPVSPSSGNMKNNLSLFLSSTAGDHSLETRIKIFGCGVIFGGLATVPRDVSVAVYPLQAFWKFIHKVSRPDLQADRRRFSIGRTTRLVAAVPAVMVDAGHTTRLVVVASAVVNRERRTTTAPPIVVAVVSIEPKPMIGESGDRRLPVESKPVAPPDTVVAALSSRRSRRQWWSSPLLSPVDYGGDGVDCGGGGGFPAAAVTAVVAAAVVTIEVAAAGGDSGGSPGGGGGDRVIIIAGVENRRSTTEFRRIGGDSMTF